MNVVLIATFHLKVTCLKSAQEMHINQIAQQAETMN